MIAMNDKTVYRQMDLSGTDFFDLTDAIIVHCDISNCRFGNCKGANFTHSYGKGADFSKADISNTSFENVNIEGMKFDGATWNGQTVMWVLAFHTTGFPVFVTNAFIQMGCMQKSYPDWGRICDTKESMRELLDEQPKLNIDHCWEWWCKYRSVIIGLTLPKGPPNAVCEWVSAYGLNGRLSKIVPEEEYFWHPVTFKNAPMPEFDPTELGQIVQTTIK